MERQMQIKESKEEINGFTLAKNAKDMAILKVMTKTPWEIAQHPYLSSDYEYVTITKGDDHIFTIVKEDGTTFSSHFGRNGYTLVSEDISLLQKKAMNALKNYGVIMDIPTLDLPYKMNIYYNRNFQSWQANLSFQGFSREQNIWISKLKNEEEMCKEIEERFKIKFKPLVHGYAQTGIDIWKTERDYHQEQLLSTHKKEEQAENKNIHSNVNPKNIVKTHNKQERNDKEK